MKLQDNVSLITGAGSGIGRATALRFAAEGAVVVAVDLDEAAALETQCMIESQGQKALGLRVDVSQETQVKSAIATTLSTYGRLDILFNNAGLSILKSIPDTTEAELDKLLAVNFKGLFFGCKHAMPIMATQGSGVIINTASELALVGQPLYGAYCATKGAILSFTRTLALECAAQGIRANVICPGPVATPLLQVEFDLADDPAAEAAAAAKDIPAGRLGTPEDIANLVTFLASDEASFIHGAALTADGGRTIL
ncbi:MAG: glucose 1-dehydrogenase [Cyanobacteria bacterium P01_A01_bin.116]